MICFYDTKNILSHKGQIGIWNYFLFSIMKKLVKKVAAFSRCYPLLIFLLHQSSQQLKASFVEMLDQASNSSYHEALTP